MEKTDEAETHKESHKSESGGRRKHILAKLALILAVGSFFSLLVCALLIHFTNLKYNSRIDPIETVRYKARSMAATTDVERANFHIAESERLVAEMRKPAAANSYFVAEAKPHKKMIWHNEEATRYMLAAEAGGANLKELGLIKRLCDNLGAQYAFITSTDAGNIREEDKLYTRVVEKGEDLQTVFEQIERQLQVAMNW